MGHGQRLVAVPAAGGQVEATIMRRVPLLMAPVMRRT